MTKTSPANKSKDGLWPELKPLKKTHAVRIGEICWAWNDLHSQFLFIFSLLIDKSNLNPGISLWHSSAGDKAQRQMLKALAEARLKEDSPILEGIKWACHQADCLAGPRNAFVHAPIAYITTPGAMKLVPSALGSPRFVKKLESTDNRELFKLLRKDLNLLTAYTNRVFTQLLVSPPASADKLLTLLEKPILRCDAYYNHPPAKAPPGGKKKASPHPP